MNDRLERETVDHLAVEAVAKTRADLIMSHTFYGVLISQVEPLLSRKFPTMATNGKVHYFNPDYILKLTPNERLGVQRHESEHDARKHHSRRGNRDPKKWNIATDYAINIDLVDEGMVLPEGALVDPQYRGWSAEEIYRARELDEQRQNQADEDSEDDESEDDNDGGNGASNGDESEPEHDDEADGGDGDESEADDGDDEADSGGGDADEEGDETEAQGGNGNGEAEGEESEAGSVPASTGDPGGMGEVLDAAEDEAGLAESDANWDRVVREAATLAEKRGDLPGHVSRDIKREGETRQNWREQLRAWFDQGSLKTETWSRPNRRFVAGGLILPGTVRDGINKAVFLIDTSGSMDAIALKAIAIETQAALDDGAIDEVVVIYGDTRVTRVDTYRTGDYIEFDPRGGGGTDLKPMFEYVEQEVADASLIVAFTDGFIGEAGPQPTAPVLWAYTGYPDNVRRMIATAPWGAPAIDVGEH